VCETELQECVSILDGIKKRRAAVDGLAAARCDPDNIRKDRCFHIVLFTFHILLFARFMAFAVEHRERVKDPRQQRVQALLHSPQRTGEVYNQRPSTNPGE